MLTEYLWYCVPGYIINPFLPECSIQPGIKGLCYCVHINVF